MSYSLNLSFSMSFSLCACPVIGPSPSAHVLLTEHFLPFLIHHHYSLLGWGLLRVDTQFGIDDTLAAFAAGVYSNVYRLTLELDHSSHARSGYVPRDLSLLILLLCHDSLSFYSKTLSTPCLFLFVAFSFILPGAHF